MYAFTKSDKKSVSFKGNKTHKAQKIKHMHFFQINLTAAELFTQPDPDYMGTDCNEEEPGGKEKTLLMCHFALNQNINEKEEEKAPVCASDTCSALQEKGTVEEM